MLGLVSDAAGAGVPAAAFFDSVIRSPSVPGSARPRVLSVVWMFLPGCKSQPPKILASESLELKYLRGVFL